MTELANVNDAYNLHKIGNYKDGPVTDEDLVKSGLLKKVFIKDTYRTIGIITDLEKIGIKSEFGKGAQKQEKTEKETLLDMYNVYGIDFADGTLYYIRNGVWSIDGEKVELAENGMTVKKYKVETLNQEYIEDRMFKTKWNVTLGDEEGSDTYRTVVLPLTAGSVYDATIHWGDGTSTVLKHKVDGITLTTDELKAKVTHTYTLDANDDGIKEIKISGKYTDFRMGTSISEPTKLKLIEIEQWGNTNFTNLNFSNCINLAGTIPGYNIEGCFKDVKSFEYLFSKCSNIEKLADGFVIPNNVTKMNSTFNECSGLTSLPEGFTISSGVSNMDQVFSYCAKLKGKITIKANPTSYNSSFRSVAEDLGGVLIIDYTLNCTNIDDIIATGNANYVKKGSLVE